VISVLREVLILAQGESTRLRIIDDIGVQRGSSYMLMLGRSRNPVSILRDIKSALHAAQQALVLIVWIQRGNPLFG